MSVFFLEPRKQRNTRNLVVTCVCGFIARGGRLIVPHKSDLSLPSGLSRACPGASPTEILDEKDVWYDEGGRVGVRGVAFHTSRDMSIRERVICIDQSNREVLFLKSPLRRRPLPKKRLIKPRSPNRTFSLFTVARE